MLLSSRIWKQAKVKGNRVYQGAAFLYPSDGRANGNGKAAEPPDPERERREVLENARAEAVRQREEILRESREEAEKIREAAHREGFDEGYREGLERGQREAENLRREAEEVLAEARRRREEIIASAEPEVVRLALEMAEKILHRRLKEDPEAVVDVVVRALQEIPYGSPIQVRVNPDDEVTCRQAEERMYRCLRGAAEIEIITDDGVPRGGCRVETADGRVEVLPEEEMACLREQLLALTGGPRSG